MTNLEIVVPGRFSYLAPVKTDLIRVGSSRDGGYVVSRKSVEDSQALISLGLSSEWSFDSDFLAHRKKLWYCTADRGSGFLVYLLACLRSIVKHPLRLSDAARSLAIAFRFLRLVPPIQVPRRRRFFRKWVRSHVTDTERDMTLQPILQSIPVRTGLFLKMDIEGGEYELLPEILDIAEQNSGYFSGLCIEFHAIMSREAEFHSLVHRMQKTFEIVHLHANNAVPAASDFLDVLEISFATKSGDEVVRVRRLPLPGLDFPNNPEEPDLELVFT
jgi:hypothetical protein